MKDKRIGKLGRYLSNPVYKEKQKEYHKGYYEEHKAEIRAKLKQKYVDHRDDWYVKLYDLAPGEYDRLLQEQQGVCAICHKTHGKILLVDHDHKTGKVRGLLCRGCNMRLGWYENHLDEIGGYLYR